MEEQNRLETVLIVDDNTVNLTLLRGALKGEYNIKAAKSGSRALDIVSTVPVDIILLDVMMPEMDGFETCRRLKKDPLTSGIPVIFITANAGSEFETKGFNCGAVDYITKPISVPAVQARLRAHLALHNQNRRLDEKVRVRTAELNESRLEILNKLGRAAEFKDNETGLHIVRMSRYCRIIALEYGLSEADAELLYNASPMHDIGKIGIPDAIMFKEEKLNDEEWQQMKKHCEIGFKIINSETSTLLKTSGILAYTHHERWDGSGYPEGKSGTDIPLFSRILSIADVFDALTSIRPYKNAWSTEDAVTEIKRCSGSHFDPSLVDLFLRCLPQIVMVKQEFAEPD